MKILEEIQIASLRRNKITVRTSCFGKNLRKITLTLPLMCYMKKMEIRIQLIFEKITQLEKNKSYFNWFLIKNFAKKEKRKKKNIQKIMLIFPEWIVFVLLEQKMILSIMKKYLQIRIFAELYCHPRRITYYILINI